MSDTDKMPTSVALVMMIVCILFGIVGGLTLAEGGWRREAVKRGHAAWVTNAEGNAEFQWGDPKK